MDKNIIAQKLVALRDDKSREDVATSLNISVSALQMYENGQRIPRDEIKVKLANFYGVSVQSLFFEQQPHEMCSKSTNQQPA